MKRLTFSLRNTTVVLIVGPLLVATSLLGLVGHHLLRDVVTRFHGMFVGNIFVAVDEAVETHFGQGVRFLDEFAHLSSLSPDALQDEEELGRYLAERLRYQHAIAWLSFSSAHNGLFVGARRDTEGRIIINISHPDQRGGIPQEWVMEADGRKMPHDVGPVTAYDPRLRPWYQQALAADHAIWTPVYRFHEGQMGVTCALSCRDAEGRVLGVFTVDFLADQVVGFLERLRTGDKGFVFLCNRSGGLLAPRRLSDAQQTALSLAVASLPVTKATDPNLGIRLREGKETYLLARRELIPAARTGWWCGVLVPEQEIWGTLFESLISNTVVALGLASLALLLATLVAALVSRRLDMISRDMEQVSAEAPVAVPDRHPSRVREIASLQASVMEVRRLALRRQEQERARLLAESISRAKSDAMAMVSHDLRSPLQSIIGYSDMLMAEPEGLPEDRKAALSAIMAGAQTMLQIVNNYLDLLQLSEKGLAVHASRIDIEPLCRECASLVYGLVLEKKLSLTVNTAPGTGAIDTDRDKLKQILMNLLGNAIKFTSSGGVRLQAERGRDGVIFTVEDTGIGMTSEQSAHVFEAFTQADPSIAVKYGGSGLGLTIAMKLTELLGGRIRLESAPGCGTRVTVTLPQHRNNLTAPSLAMPAGDSSG